MTDPCRLNLLNKVFIFCLLLPSTSQIRDFCSQAHCRLSYIIVIFHKQIWVLRPRVGRIKRPCCNALTKPHSAERIIIWHVHYRHWSYANEFITSAEYEEHVTAFNSWASTVRVLHPGLSPSVPWYRAVDSPYRLTASTTLGVRDGWRTAQLRP